MRSIRPLHGKGKYTMGLKEEPDAIADIFA
jgi:hypothetical protein